MPITPRNMSCCILKCQTRVCFSRLPAQQSGCSSFQWRDAALGCHLAEAFNARPSFLWRRGWMPVLLFACIHGDVDRESAPSASRDQKSLIRSSPQLWLFTLLFISSLPLVYTLSFSRKCLFLSCAIRTSPALSPSPCSLVFYCLKFICSLITSHPFSPLSASLCLSLMPDLVIFFF